MGEDVATPETHEMSYGKTEQAVAVVQLAGLGDAQNQAGIDLQLPRNSCSFGSQLPFFPLKQEGERRAGTKGRKGYSHCTISSGRYAAAILIWVYSSLVFVCF